MAKNYPEWSDRKILIDRQNRFATCYQNDDGSIFYIEPQYYTYLQGYRRHRPERYPEMLKKRDEVVRKNRKVVFVGMEDNPLVEAEGAIYLTAEDIANLIGCLIQPESRGSDYGD